MAQATTTNRNDDQQTIYEQSSPIIHESYRTVTSRVCGFSLRRQTMFFVVGLRVIGAFDWLAILPSNNFPTLRASTSLLPKKGCL